MIYRVSLIGLLVFVMVVIVSCTSKVALSPQTPTITDNTNVQQSTSKEPWETEWENALKGARKEGKINIRSASSGNTVRKATSLLKQRFGIDLEITYQRGAEIVATLSAERKAGIYSGDLIFTGTNTFFNQLEPSGWIEPMDDFIILPENKDLKNWYKNTFPWGSEEHTLIKLYARPGNQVEVNTNLVNPAEIKSYDDLLNPKWKGKIVMNDPTIAGSGLKAFGTLGFHILGLDYFRKLATLQPMITRNQRLQVEWLAQGKYSVGLFIPPEQVVSFIDAGAPLAFVMPKEGTHLTNASAGLVRLNKAPHPNAAKVFTNWIISREGMLFLSNNDRSQTSRTDIPIDMLLPSMVRVVGVDYFMGAEDREWLKRDDEFVAAAREIFGDLLGK